MASSKERMRSYLQRVATGPRLSKDLSRDEARDALELILRGEVVDVQAAVLLIALRMKRETDDENRGALDALRGESQWAQAAVCDLVEISDPYDGFVRHLPASPFLPAVLAACGVPAVAHGCRALGPKWGATTRLVLQAAGAPTDTSPAQAARAVADQAVGWAYVDVEHYLPALHRLATLRELIVKRPLLATLEKLTGPVRGQRNHLVVGYVHRGYEALLTTLARGAGYHSALVVKGIEGGVVPSLTASATAVGYTGGPDSPDAPLALDPHELGIAAAERAAPVPETAADAAAIARAAASAGMAALEGAPGLTRDALIHGASAILARTGFAPSRVAAAARVREALDTGRARARFSG
jgi:anthranilate phosphoribosyltransferase